MTLTHPLVRCRPLLRACCVVHISCIRMAPEVLLSDEYNELADVWSLGITAYELAVGEPPHAKLHSMRAAVKIPQSAPPTLPDPETWSGDFHSFIAACLVKDPNRRPSAEALLHHPFIARAAEPAVIVPLIAQREREAGTTHRKANNIGSGDSLDSLDDTTAAPLSKPPQQPQPLQQQQQQQTATVAVASNSQGDTTGTVDSERTQISNVDNLDRTHEHWNNVEDEHSEQSAGTPRQHQHTLQQPLDDTHTRTLPHPLSAAGVDNSPPRRLQQTATASPPFDEPHERLHQEQHIAMAAYDAHSKVTALRASASSPALSQPPSMQSLDPFIRRGQQPPSASAAAALTEGVDSHADSSRRHFFPSLPSASAPSASLSSSSPSSSNSPLHHDDIDGELNLATDWSEAGSRQAERGLSVGCVTLHGAVETNHCEHTPAAAWPVTQTST